MEDTDSKRLCDGIGITHDKLMLSQKPEIKKKKINEVLEISLFGKQKK
jgi:hypothetical protein